MCQSSSILRTCCGFYLTRVTGGASRAEQERPGLMWALLPRSPRPSPVLDVPPLSRALHSRLPQEEQQLYSDREHGASPARQRHAFGTGTSQSIACMFGDALL